MAGFTEHCEIGQYFRKWMMAVPGVSDICGNVVIDSVPNFEKCIRPFIYYSMEDANDSEALCDGFDDYDYVVEVCGPEERLPEVRNLKMNLLLAAQSYVRGEAFGHADYTIQSMEIIKVRDGYQSMMAAYLPKIVFSIFAVRITP